MYTASKYTFSPPDLGNMVPNSSQMNRPQKESTKPRTQSMSDAPTEPTDPRMEEGVEKMPVPMIRPTLYKEVSERSTKGQVLEDVHEQRAAEHAEVTTHAFGGV